MSNDNEVTDMEIFRAELKRARDLGLDLNKLDLDALDRTLMSGKNFGQESGVMDASVDSAEDLEKIYGDNAYFSLSVPKTGNKELDRSRLQQAWDNSFTDQGLVESRGADPERLGFQ